MLVLPRGLIVMYFFIQALLGTTSLLIQKESQTSRKDQSLSDLKCLGGLQEKINGTYSDEEGVERKACG